MSVLASTLESQSLYKTKWDTGMYNLHFAIRSFSSTTFPGLFFGYFQICCLGNQWFAPRLPVVFVISVVSVISTNPALNSLFVAVWVVFVVFVISVVFVKGGPHANHRFRNTWLSGLFSEKCHVWISHSFHTKFVGQNKLWNPRGLNGNEANVDSSWLKHQDFVWKLV